MAASPHAGLAGVKDGLIRQLIKDVAEHRPPLGADPPLEVLFDGTDGALDPGLHPSAVRREGDQPRAAVSGVASHVCLERLPGVAERLVQQHEHMLRIDEIHADWRRNLLWEQELRVSEPVTPEPFRVGTRCAGFGSPALAHRRRGDHRVRVAPAAGQ
jgi:hypothetical protein